MCLLAPSKPGKEREGPQHDRPCSFTSHNHIQVITYVLSLFPCSIDWKQITIHSQGFDHIVHEHRQARAWRTSRICLQDVPGDASSGRETACQCRDTGLTLVREDPTRHTAIKRVCDNYWASALEAMLHKKGSCCNEKPTRCNEEYPHLAATRKSPHTATKTQHSHK